MLLGTVFTFAHHREYLESPLALPALIAPTNALHTIAEVAHFCLAERGQAFIALGLLVLVATPVMRVALSILIFWQERDRIFVVVTATVLALLLLSFVLGAGEAAVQPSPPPAPVSTSAPAP